MTLRKGIEWSDGKPFTANDVVFTFNLVRDNQNKLINTAEIGFLKEAVAVDDRNREVRPEAAEPALVGDDADQQPRRHRADPAEAHLGGPGPADLHLLRPGEGLADRRPGRTSWSRRPPQQKVFDLRHDWWAVKTGFKPLPKVERVIYIPQPRRHAGGPDAGQQPDRHVARSCPCRR